MVPVGIPLRPAAPADDSTGDIDIPPAIGRATDDTERSRSRRCRNSRRCRFVIHPYRRWQVH